MPKRMQLIWDLAQGILEKGRGSFEDLELEEALALVGRELTCLETGLIDSRDASSIAFVKSILCELHPLISCSWDKLSDPQKEELQGIRLRALRLSLRQREEGSLVSPISVEEPESSRLAQAS